MNQISKLDFVPKPSVLYPSKVELVVFHTFSAIKKQFWSLYSLKQFWSLYISKTQELKNYGFQRTRTN